MITYTVLFGHLKSVSAKVGEQFRQDDYLKATEGSSGMADGRHIHLAVAAGKITNIDKMRLTPLNKGNPKPNKEECLRFIDKNLYQGGYRVTTTYLEKEYKKIYGIDHPAIDITSTSGGNPKIYWVIKEVGTVAAVGQNDSGYGNYLMISYTINPFNLNPVEKDPSKDQLEIIVDDLRVRSSTNTTTTSNILGFAKKGYYNYLSTTVANGYTWYELEKDKFVAYNKDWINIYLKNEKEDDNPITEFKKFTSPKDGIYWIELKKDDIIYWE